MSRIIGNLLRQSPLVRAGIVVFLFVIVSIISFALSAQKKRVPEIISVEPAVGVPGDIMTISGRNFGPAKSTVSYVEISGSRLTSSSYLSWSDTSIRVVLPSNIADGLVFVGTVAGRSKPDFFTNRANIPVQVRPDARTSVPAVHSVTPEKAYVGQVLTVSGLNFGSSRGKSQVLFSSGKADSFDSDAEFIPASEADFDYEYWDDTEIRVRVPDGATGGVLFVKTGKGESNRIRLELDASLGTKTFSAKRTYLVQVSADIDAVAVRDNAVLTLHIPKPPVFAQQPSVEMTECVPPAEAEDFRGAVLQQMHLNKGMSGKKRFTSSFVVSVYAANSVVREAAVRPYKDTASALYVSATHSDAYTDSGRSDVIAKAAGICGTETNPYTMARLLYNYSVAHPNKDVYDWNAEFVALARASGIPCVPVSGVLLDSDMKCRNHWWAEFYIERIGWIPVDLLQRTFGSLDNQHIAFSRGWNAVRPMQPDNKVVQRPKSYALQSVWEETDSEVVSYSSLWNDPVILGIY